MKTSQVYQKYQIMPQLQKHMYRVTGVAYLICKNFSPTFETTEIKNVLTACLLHDMGNIIKFDLTYFPQSLEPLGLDHWQKVKQQYCEKYGENEHYATIKLALELGVSDRVIELLNSIGFARAKENLETPDMSRRICAYADTRVTPFSVVSLEERFADLEKRYAAKYPTFGEKLKREEYREMLRQIEAQIFTQCSLAPAEVTEEKVTQLQPELENFEI